MLFHPAHLRNLPVLAERTLHIASHRAYGQGLGARKKMIERFFFDGVDVDGGDFAIHQVDQTSAFVFVYTAHAGLTFAQLAVVAAQFAANASAFQFVVKLGKHGFSGQHAFTHFLRIFLPDRQKFRDVHEGNRRPIPPFDKDGQRTGRIPAVVPTLAAERWPVRLPAAE